MWNEPNDLTRRLTDRKLWILMIDDLCGISELDNFWTPRHLSLAVRPVLVVLAAAVCRVPEFCVTHPTHPRLM